MRNKTARVSPACVDNMKSHGERTEGEGNWAQFRNCRTSGRETNPVISRTGRPPFPSHSSSRGLSATARVRQRFVVNALILSNLWFSAAARIDVDIAIVALLQPQEAGKAGEPEEAPREVVVIVIAIICGRRGSRGSRTIRRGVIRLDDVADGHRLATARVRRSIRTPESTGGASRPKGRSRQPGNPSVRLAGELLF